MPPSVFIPQPNVASAVIKLTVRKTPPVQVDNEAFMFEVVQSSFAQRRKTIANNLKTRFFAGEGREQLEKLLAEANIEPTRRAETLSIEEFAKLSNILFAAGLK
ncbi:Ribosomal RNA small subunit methyltransferase A [compost metagenome]